MNNNFIWTDLSTFNVRIAKQFYGASFGWQFKNIGDGYLTCYAQKVPSAGLYRMPDFFQKINMPSFWMSYIHVSNINETVQLAEQLGAKIEVQPEAAPGGGQIALIRDPAGAGFTCYEGEALGGRDAGNNAGRMVWNELHVSALSTIEAFYTTLFQWQIRSTEQANRYEIYSNGHLIAGIQVSPNEIREIKSIGAFTSPLITSMRRKHGLSGLEAKSSQNSPLALNPPHWHTIHKGPLFTSWKRVGYLSQWK